MCQLQFGWLVSFMFLEFSNVHEAIVLFFDVSSVLG